MQNLIDAYKNFSSSINKDGNGFQTGTQLPDITILEKMFANTMDQRFFLAKVKENATSIGDIKTKEVPEKYQNMNAYYSMAVDVQIDEDEAHSIKWNQKQADILSYVLAIGIKAGWVEKHKNVSQYVDQRMVETHIHIYAEPFLERAGKVIETYQKVYGKWDTCHNLFKSEWFQ